MLWNSCDTKQEVKLVLSSANSQWPLKCHDTSRSLSFVLLEIISNFQVINRETYADSHVKSSMTHVVQKLQCCLKCDLCCPEPALWQ